MEKIEDAILSCRGVTKSYGRGHGENRVLHGVDMDVRAGEFVAVMGPSGCGKSTLLHILGLMTPANSGSVYIAGAEVPSNESARTKLRRNSIGFVFQRFNLISTLSAIENIRISLRVRGKKDAGQAGELLELMGVSHVSHRKPGKMSIGEQQRVAAARALAHKPAIILADEPTGNLDSESGGALLELFRDINEKNSQTIVMITHSAQAAEFAGRTVRMKDGLLHE